MALFNAELARSAAAKSTEARRQYAAQRKQWEKIQATLPPIIHQQSEPEPIAKPIDAYAEKLARAQNELLDELLNAQTAKDKAALSQALKNLRETYHMATGAPKPGTIKPERQSSRQQVKQPSEPKLDDTTGSGQAS